MPDGFNFGYMGSGPSQLSLALAADVLGDDDRAQQVYQALKSRVVAGLPGEEWELTEARLREVIAGIVRERGAGRGR